MVNSPNADAGSHGVRKAYDEYRQDPDFFFFNNLPRNRFVNLLRHAAFLIGNSSMGLLESASVPVPAINVGLRQRGRMAPETVVFVNGTEAAIGRAIDRVTSAAFQSKLRAGANPYGDGRSVPRAVRLIRTLDLRGMLLKRKDPLKPRIS
jgi:UDP-N-acetylglucosamine 2-epimerase